MEPVRQLLPLRASLGTLAGERTVEYFEGGAGAVKKSLTHTCPTNIDVHYELTCRRLSKDDRMLLNSGAQFEVGVRSCGDMCKGGTQQIHGLM